jgi:hypothetical protein
VAALIAELRQTQKSVVRCQAAADALRIYLRQVEQAVGDVPASVTEVDSASGTDRVSTNH